MVRTLALFAGCQPSVPLPETPIVGGSEEQRELVRLELEAFDRDIGSDRLSVPEIRIEEFPKGAASRRHSYRITLDDDLGAPDLRWILRHELCHALDFEEDLVAESVLFDTLADGYFADDDLHAVDVAYPTARRRRSEAFATFCSLGALPNHAVQTGCGTEPALVAELSTWLAAEVWRGFETEDTVWDAGQAVGSTTGLFPNALFVAPTVVPVGGLDVRTWEGQTYEGRVVDLHTGGELDVDGEVVRVATARFAGGLIDDLTDPWVVGADDGPRAAVGQVYLWHLGTSEPRVFVTDDDGDWTVVSPSCEPAQTVFVAEDRVWVGWVDGQRVEWTPLRGP